MSEAEADSRETQPWYSKIAMIAALPLAPAILAYVVLYAYTDTYLSERRIRIRMQRAGRFLGLSNARSRISEAGGTLIIENPTIGWDITRAWWTPEDVLAKSPFPVPSKEERKKAELDGKSTDWDNWCWQNYTRLEDGRAFLLRVWNGAKSQRTVSTSFPDLHVVNTRTGIAIMRDLRGNLDQK